MEGKEMREEIYISARLKNHQKQTKKQKKKKAKEGRAPTNYCHILFLTQKVDENESQYIFQ